MATRPQVSPGIAENDGPAGAAVVARVLSEALDVIPVLLAEERLLPALTAVFQAAGLTPVSLLEAGRVAAAGARLSVVVPRPYPVDVASDQAPVELLEQIRPALAFSTERAGRNSRGVYHGSRGVDYRVGLAQIDRAFEEAARRGIPTLCVGDGGNEIGMGLVAEAVQQHVRFGDRCLCGCGGGIGAVTGADVLVTAAVSNWGCIAVANCLAVLLDRKDLLHTAPREAALLRRGVEVGLINSSGGRVDADVDGIPEATHLAVAELLREICDRG